MNIFQQKSSHNKGFRKLRTLKIRNSVKTANTRSIMVLMTVSLITLLASSVAHFAYAETGERYDVSIEKGVREVQVDQQIQITADLVNNQNRDQPFAYLVQIQNEDRVTISLSWIAGSLAPGQSMSPSQSWTPTEPGRYNAQIFVWESVDNPDALSAPLAIKINVV